MRGLYIRSPTPKKQVRRARLLAQLTCSLWVTTDHLSSTRGAPPRATSRCTCRHIQRGMQAKGPALDPHARTPHL